MKQILRRLTCGAAVSAALTVGFVIASGDSISAFVTNVFAYAVSLDATYETIPLLSAGDTVPESSQPGKKYQMVGIPDGLGAYRNRNETITLLMNHELPGSVDDTGGTLSEPVIGDPLNRGAIVSKFILSSQGEVLSGERAYDHVFLDDAYVGPAAEVGNMTPPFARFCSASLAGPEHGFDRHIYFANEESGGAATFDGKGGLSVAIFDNEAHALPSLGRFAWENTLVQPSSRNSRHVLIMGMEDGPVNQDTTLENSQLYMYIGWKDSSVDATVLERNGLVGGVLFVFKAKDPAMNSEALFKQGSILGQWVYMGNVSALSDVQLEAASDFLGAMPFARPEDGAFNPNDRNEYFFVTTGGAIGANELGRLYSLRLNPLDPTRDARLTVVYNADMVIAAGGDTAISPDNIDASEGYLMIQEDGTTQSRAVMSAKGRDGSIWRFDILPWWSFLFPWWSFSPHNIDVASATRVVELDPPGRDGVAVGAGIWETSGIIDTSGLLGRGSWLFDVQAHAPTAAPAPNTVEDGQLLLLKRVRGSNARNDD